jgi:hypothetical protein
MYTKIISLKKQGFQISPLQSKPKYNPNTGSSLLSIPLLPLASCSLQSPAAWHPLPSFHPARLEVASEDRSWCMGLPTTTILVVNDTYAHGHRRPCSRLHMATDLALVCSRGGRWLAVDLALACSRSGCCSSQLYARGQCAIANSALQTSPDVVVPGDGGRQRLARSFKWARERTEDWQSARANSW